MRHASVLVNFTVIIRFAASPRVSSSSSFLRIYHYRKLSRNPAHTQGLTCSYLQFQHASYFPRILTVRATPCLSDFCVR